jgi:hypothetical protein
MFSIVRPHLRRELRPGQQCFWSENVLGILQLVPVGQAPCRPAGLALRLVNLNATRKRIPSVLLAPQHQRHAEQRVMTTARASWHVLFFLIFIKAHLFSVVYFYNLIKNHMFFTFSGGRSWNFEAWNPYKRLIIIWFIVFIYATKLPPTSVSWGFCFAGCFLCDAEK